MKTKLDSGSNSGTAITSDIPFLKTGDDIENFTKAVLSSAYSSKELERAIQQCMDSIDESSLTDDSHFTVVQCYFTAMSAAMSGVPIAQVHDWIDIVYSHLVSTEEQG